MDETIDPRQLADRLLSEDVPTGFKMTRTGLYWQPDDPEKQRVKVSGPFNIIAETRDRHFEDWGVFLQWKDNDGHSHEWAMPKSLLSGDGAEVRARLLSGGLYVSPRAMCRQLLNSYILDTKAEARARCVNSVGWHGVAYVTSSATYGDTAGEHIILQSAAPVPRSTQDGTFEGWQKEVASLAIGNSRLAFAMSAAFAGPLLHIALEDSFGMHFRGRSSLGKTTSLHLAASVAGSVINTWRTTDNSAEATAAANNDGLLLLDEISQVEGRAIDAMAYMLGNGAGKNRMRKDATNRPTATWRIVFLSTGEEGLAEKLAEVGKKLKAGQEVRLIEIPSDTGSGHGFFENLHGHTGGDSFSRHLRFVSERHRGHAMERYLKKITSDLPALLGSINAAKKLWLERYLPAASSGQVSRVAARFALIAAAGELASAMGILPWPDRQAELAAETCFRAWLDKRGNVGASEASAGVDQVRNFISLHGSSRFSAVWEANPSSWDSKPPDAGADSRTINRAGFRRKDEQGNWNYYVLPAVWTGEICRGFNGGEVAKELAAKDLLVLGKDRAAIQLKIPGLGNTRLYHVLPAILVGDDIA